MTEKKVETATSKYKVDEDTATAEFDRFMEMMDIDVDPAGMDDEDKVDFGRHKGLLVKVIRRGSLVINDKGEPVFTPQRGEGGSPITFHEPKGSAIMAMDRKKRGHDVGKMFASIADMTGTSSSTYSNMYSSDLKICLAIATLFLA